MGECRFCGLRLMSDSTVCIICCSLHLRDCTCHEKVQVGVTKGGQLRYELRPCKTCKQCQGKGWYYDEAPASSIPTAGTRPKPAH